MWSVLSILAVLAIVAAMLLTVPAARSGEPGGSVVLDSAAQDDQTWDVFDVELWW